MTAVGPRRPRTPYHGTGRPLPVDRVERARSVFSLRSRQKKRTPGPTVMAASAKAVYAFIVAEFDSLFAE